MDDDDWTPPTEEEMKLMEARRARADQISKLMASYLLKGYKMLGVSCSKPNCETILLQDRSGTNHCVACEELDCDTDKDNPALRPPGPTGKVKSEPNTETATASTTVASATLATASSALFSPRTPRGAACSPRLAEESGDYLSMSSIDVHCWPPNSSHLEPNVASGAGGDHANSGTSKSPVVVGRVEAGTDVQQQASVTTRDQASFTTREVYTSTDISACIPVLQKKILCATQALEQKTHVDSSIALCKLIKQAAEAIVAVRNASL